MRARLVDRKPKGLERLVERVRRVQPPYLALGTEPGALSFRERQIATSVLFDCMLPAGGAIRQRPGFVVADRRKRR